LKERCFDVFSKRNKRTKYGEKDISMNYMKHLMIKTLSIISKLKDWQGQGTFNAASKLQIYKSIIRPTVTYGCETWAMTVTDQNRLLVFERRVLRKI
jgi:hypothetical protein